MNRLISVSVVLVVIVSATFAWLKLRPVKALPTPVNPAASITAAPVPAAPEPELAPVAPPEPIPAPPTPVVAIEEGPRTWTNRDGRTLKADFISATETTVTVRRSDGVVFTIPLANLLADDSAWVARQSKTPEPVLVITPASQAKPAAPVITQQQLDKIVANFPAAPALSGREVTNDLQQLHTKYHGMVKFMRPNTLAPSLKMIRNKIADDIKVLSAIAGTANGDWSGKRGSSQSAAAENTILSARQSLAWLEGSLSRHLDFYEALLTSSE